MDRSVKLSFKITDPANTVHTKHKNVRIKFKMSVEIARNLKGRTLSDGIRYLNNVCKFKDIVKVTKFAKKCGRKKQANSHLIVNGKKYSDNRGRWPVKPAKLFLSLLNLLIKNAESKSLDPAIIKLCHINVNRAPQINGRMQRAFGRVTAANSHPCHIEIVAAKPPLKIDELD